MRADCRPLNKSMSQGKRARNEADIVIPVKIMTANKDFVFHYTGAGAVLNIIKKRQLWATSTEFLNDRFEGFLPKQKMTWMVDRPDSFLRPVPRPPSKHLEALGISLRSGKPAVTTSFSRSYDSLPQFRMYAPHAGGVAIGFPRSYLKKVATLIECDYSDANLWSWCRSHVQEFFAHAAKIDADGMSAQDLSNAIMRTTDMHDKRGVAGLKFKAAEFSNEEEERLYTFMQTEFRECDFTEVGAQPAKTTYK